MFAIDLLRLRFVGVQQYCGQQFEEVCIAFLGQVCTAGSGHDIFKPDLAHEAQMHGLSLSKSHLQVY